MSGVENGIGRTPNTSENTSPDSGKIGAESDGLDPKKKPSKEGSFEEVSKSEARYEQRRRRRVIEQMGEALGLSGDDMIQALASVQKLLPDPDRMSRGEHIAERLDHAMQDMRVRPPELIFNRFTKKPIDTTDPRRFFAENEAMEGLFESEEGLLRAWMVNERSMAGVHRMVAEHEAVRSMIRAEIVRRSTLVEQWRHLLPKYMLPIFAMLNEAGAKQKDLRLNGKLFNRIRDAVIDWSDGAISREDLMAAAMRSEEEFAAVMEAGEGEAVSTETPSSTGDVQQPGVISQDDGFENVVEEVSATEETDDTPLEGDTAKIEKSGGPAAFLNAEEGAPEDAENPAPEPGSLPVSEPKPKPDLEPVEPAHKQRRAVDDWSQDDAGFGPDIPNDLFGSEPGEDPDDMLESASDDASEKRLEDTADRHETMVESVSADNWNELSDVGAEPIADGADSLVAEDDILPPVEATDLAFSPDRVAKWPQEMFDVIDLIPDLPRSTGLSRSTGSSPFTRWRPETSKEPFCFMGFRRHPDLSARAGKEGVIEPADLSRIELGEGQWRCISLPRQSNILGASHALMLPPHSSLEWYGEKLGWSATDIWDLGAFGSPTQPESISPKGDHKKLIDAMRGVARLRLEELASQNREHFLADTQAGPGRREVASEDLARWWMFVLVTRHRQAEFDMLMPEFFHGIHGPEIAIGSDGEVIYGTHFSIGVWSLEVKERLEALGAEASDADMGIGEPYRGARRRAP